MDSGSRPGSELYPVVDLYSIGVIGTVAAEPIQNGLMVAIFDIEERGKAYGLLRSIGSLAGLVLMPAVGQLANVPDGWRYGMYLMGGLSLVSGLLLAIFLKEPPHRVVEDDPDAGKFKLSDVPKIFRIPTVPLLAIYLLLIGPLVKALGTLDRVMLFMVSVPYAVNAIYWFVFYGPYRRLGF